MAAPTLHPNLARVAAQYDEIADRVARHELSDAAGAALVAQLEARDDNGVRWGLDPATGQWFRKTAFGDMQYDQEPPTFGVPAADGFAYSEVTVDDSRMATLATRFNPNNQLAMAPTVPAGPAGTPGTPAPGIYPGTTFRAAPDPRDHGLWAVLRRTPRSVKIATVGAVVLLAALGLRPGAAPHSPATTPSSVSSVLPGH